MPVVGTNPCGGDYACQLASSVAHNNSEQWWEKIFHPRISTGNVADIMLLMSQASSQLPGNPGGEKDDIDTQYWGEVVQSAPTGPILPQARSWPNGTGLQKAAWLRSNVGYNSSESSRHPAPLHPPYFRQKWFFSRRQ